ncbi:hypothetical protein [Metabacillus sp. RGM 3146]|uniref:hypothetical protein n=1 Tax=Metabacillus sp. RGM 3146 TaxID=3401092 RepID=UPI003B9B263B
MSRKPMILPNALFLVFMAGTFVFFYLKGDASKSSYALTSFFCGFVPHLLTYFAKLQLKTPLVLSYLGFLFASHFLGSILKWYSLCWWDLFLHFLSGVLLVFAGTAFYCCLVPEKIRKAVPARFLFVFLFAFPVLGGVIWEIYEFSMDTFFGTKLQFGGNSDTMTDLIADTIGGFIIALFTSVQAKKKQKQAEGAGSLDEHLS